MARWVLPAVAWLGLLLLPALAAEPEAELPPDMEAEAEFDPAQIDLAALIECRSDVASYSGFAFWLNGNPEAPKRLGWRRLPSPRDAPPQYALSHPVAVFGHAAGQLVIDDDGPLALLGDVTAPALARQLRLVVMAAPPGRFLAERLVSRSNEDDRDQGLRLHMRVILQVRSATQAGRILAGCRYSLETEELTDSAG